jgi:hypothetical protein
LNCTEKDQLKGKTFLSIEAYLLLEFDLIWNVPKTKKNKMMNSLVKQQQNQTKNSLWLNVTTKRFGQRRVCEWY